MTSYEDFPCSEAVTMVTDYFEGTLSTEDRAVLERHLSWCDWCATYVDQLRDTIRLAGQLREEDVPPPVMDVLMQAFRDTHRSRD